MILPTEIIFQSSIDGAGACRLPHAYTSCRGGEAPDNEVPFCVNSTLNPDRKNDVGLDMMATHDFDEIVFVRDAYYLNIAKEASILHYAINQPQAVASKISLGTKSVYTVRYFDSVLTDLQMRGLELMMRMYGDVSTNPVQHAINDWKPLFTTSDLDAADQLLSHRKVEGGSVVYAAKSTYNNKMSDILPNNFSRRSEESEVRLPNFAIDFSDYVLGAVIERVSDSFDLYATMFLLCHEIVSPKEGKSAESGDTVSPEVHDVWKRAINSFEKTVYTPNGLRQTPPAFYCNISHTPEGPYYTVEGTFVPNSATPDSNANKRLDILRCKMEDTESAYMNLAGTSQEMFVEILRGDFSLLSFRIPWGSRKTGYMLDEPNDQVVTILDPWKGFNKSTPGIWTHDRLYMCVPGWEDSPSKATFPIFYEFIQHHLLMGVSHMFAGVTMSLSSGSFDLTRRAFSSFIDEGVLSMNTHAGDGIDNTYR